MVRVAAKGHRLKSEGAEIAIVDVRETQSLRAALRRTRRANFGLRFNSWYPRASSPSSLPSRVTEGINAVQETPFHKAH